MATGSALSGLPADAIPVGLPADAVPVAQSDNKQDPESRGFFGSLWDELKSGPGNLLGVGNSINRAVTDPKGTLSSMGQQIEYTARNAKKAAKEGNYVGAVRSAINTGINAVAPGLGTSSEQAGEKFDRGDTAGGFGQTAGIGVNTALAVRAPKIMRGAANAIPKYDIPGAPALSKPTPSSLSSLTRVDPKIAITRAYRPTPSDPNFTDRIPQTLERIKAESGGVAPSGNEAVIPAISKAIDANQSALNTWMQRAGGRVIAGDSIVQATKDATQGMLPSEQNSARALIQRAQQDYGRGFTADQLKSRLELLNNRLRSFYNKAPGAQSSALADIPESVLVAQRNATAEALYNALDPEGNGAGPRLIQRQIGDMIDLRDAALRRRNAITAEQPVSTMEKIGNAVKKIPRAVLPSRTGLSYSDTMTNRSDPLIRKAFKAVGDPNVLPKPGAELYPTGDTTRLLTPGDAIPPTPADTSFVRGAQATPADTSFVRGRPVPLLPPSSLPEPPLLTAPNSPGGTYYVPGIGYADTDLAARPPILVEPAPPIPGSAGRKPYGHPRTIYSGR